MNRRFLVTDEPVRVMHLKPPKTRKKIFKGKDADQYILNHEAIMSDGSIRNAFDVFDEFIRNAFDVFDEFNRGLILHERIERFLTLWPEDYKVHVRFFCMERIYEKYKPLMDKQQ